MKGSFSFASSEGLLVVMVHVRNDGVSLSSITWKSAQCSLPAESKRIVFTLDLSRVTQLWGQMTHCGEVCCDSGEDSCFLRRPQCAASSLRVKLSAGLSKWLLDAKYKKKFFLALYKLSQWFTTWIHACVYMCVYACMYICVHGYAQTHMYVHMSVYMWVFLCICMCVHAACAHVCVWGHTCMVHALT